MKQVRGIWLPDGDEHLTAEISLAKNPLVDRKATYQLNKYRAAMAFVKGRRHAVDVGANVGLWSRIMVKDFKAVTAIEPVYNHRACFERNVYGAKLLPVALGAEPGHLWITVPSEHIASAYIADEGEEVEVVTLDSLALVPIDFLKLDIEGYEYHAIIGGEQTIRTTKPVIILEQKPAQAERYGRGQWDAVKLLKDWGWHEARVIGGDHIMVPA